MSTRPSQRETDAEMAHLIRQSADDRQKWLKIRRTNQKIYSLKNITKIQMSHREAPMCIATQLIRVDYSNGVIIPDAEMSNSDKSF